MDIGKLAIAGIITLALTPPAFADGKGQGLKEVKRAVKSLTTDVRKIESQVASLQSENDALEVAIDQNAADIAQIQGLAGLSPQAGQIQTGLDLTSGLRWLISDFYTEQGIFPQFNAEVGAPVPSTWSNKFIEYASIEPFGEIYISFRADAAPEIAGQGVFLTPTDPGSGVIWFDCSGDGATDGYVAELACAFSDAPYEPIYGVRNQVSTALDLLEQSGAQQLIQDYANTSDLWPSDNTQAGLGPPNAYQNAYITQLVVSGNGIITMTFGSDANYRIVNGTLSWTPQSNGNSIQWSCESDAIELRFVPAVCRN